MFEIYCIHKLNRTVFDDYGQLKYLKNVIKMFPICRRSSFERSKFVVKASNSNLCAESFVLAVRFLPFMQK